MALNQDQKKELFDLFAALRTGVYFVRLELRRDWAANGRNQVQGPF